MRHILTMLVENEAGTLSRISGLFSARAFNIESLSVAPTDDPSVSRMTLVTSGSDQIIEQITKHLNRLIDVIKVVDLSDRLHIERELMLVKLSVKKETYQDIKNLSDIFRGHIIDVSGNSYTIELIGSADKLDAFIDVLRGKNIILEIVRSGTLGIVRGDKASC